MSQMTRVCVRVTRLYALTALVVFGAALSATAQTISINGVAAPNPVTVVAGTAVPLTVTDGPGNRGDWVGLFATGSDTRLAYYYLSGTGSQPATGLTSTTFTTYAPLNAGNYEWRLFANDSWTRIATSGVITVTASPATVRVNGSTSAAVAAGAQLSLSIADSPGNAGDWVGLFPVGSGTRLAYYYLNGTGSKPATGVTSATFPATAPATAGEYEWRLFLNARPGRVACRTL